MAPAFRNAPLITLTEPHTPQLRLQFSAIHFAVSLSWHLPVCDSALQRGSLSRHGGCAGEAPPARFPSVMAGVVRRSGEGLGEAREVEILGSAEKFEQLLEEVDMDFFETLHP